MARKKSASRNPSRRDSDSKKPARKKSSRSRTSSRTRAKPKATTSGRSGARSGEKKSGQKQRSVAQRTASQRKKRPGKKRPTRSGRPERGGEKRLQRVLASAGFGSRRDCEVLIEEGRVEVNGVVVTKLGTKVDPAKQKVRVDGAPIKLEKLQYFAVNKPPGVVSTSRDPSGRLRVIDLIKTEQRVYNVGRLDKSSEGLILVTNDGDLADRLTHPRYEVPKIYHVQVAGSPEVSALRELEKGVHLAEGFARVVGARIRKRGKSSSWLEITLSEGRNREIRRLLARIGHKVLVLRRIAIGTLRLGELPLGAHRRLERKEVEALWHSKPARKQAVRKQVRKPRKGTPRDRRMDTRKKRGK